MSYRRSSNPWQGRACLAAVLACCTALASAAAAQAPTPGTAVVPAVGGDSDPIACWWKTDESAVRIGQPFTLTLTCGVIDTPQVQVVVDVARLDAAAIELAPFEVVSATRHKDVEAPPRRYFQYSYTLRLLGDEYFAKDVDIPGLAITYNVQSSGATGTRGRDQVYLLPPLAVRVQSLVPVAADGILDALPGTFGDIDRTAFRSSGELVAAAVLFAFAAVLAGLAVVRVARPQAARAAAGPRLMSPVGVLNGCLREASLVKSEVARSGWTIDLIDRLLAVSRVAGTVALGRPVAQRVVERDAAPREGQLTLRKRGVGATRVVISGSATAATAAAGVAPADGSRTDPRLTVSLQELSESLQVLAAARYGRGGELDAPTIDAALDTATRALERLHAITQWRARAADRLSRATARFRDAWER